MTTAQICMMASIVVYLFAMVLIGVAYSKKTKNVSDFYLGGRKVSQAAGNIPGNQSFFCKSERGKLCGYQRQNQPDYKKSLYQVLFFEGQ